MSTQTALPLPEDLDPLDPDHLGHHGPLHKYSGASAS